MKVKKNESLIRALRHLQRYRLSDSLDKDCIELAIKKIEKLQEDVDSLNRREEAI